jgi:hypothetical protein
MKMTSFLFAGFLLVSVASFAHGAETETFTSLPTAKATKAEKIMLKVCKKEFPDNVAGKSLDDVDHWAEGQENAANPTEFKKSQCYATHEVWEKMAQRNEWAVTNPPTNPTRLPASVPASVPAK